MSIVSASLFTIAIVSIVFRHRDFHFNIIWLDTKRKLNGNRMYMLLHPNHFSMISELQHYAEFFLLFPYENRYPYRQKSPTVILNFLLQTSINVSDNSIAIVLQWQSTIVIVSQWYFLQCQY